MPAEDLKGGCVVGLRIWNTAMSGEPFHKLCSGLGGCAVMWLPSVGVGAYTELCIPMLADSAWAGFLCGYIGYTREYGVGKVTFTVQLFDVYTILEDEDDRC